MVLRRRRATIFRMMKSKTMSYAGVRALSMALAIFVGVAHGSSEAASKASSPWVSSNFSQVRLIAARSTVGDAAELRLGLHFRLEPGWKIYWRSPGDAGLPPRPDFSASGNVARVDVRWPAAQRFIQDADIETIGYVDEAVLPLTVVPARPGEPVSMRVALEYQACEKICVPLSAVLALDLPAGVAEPTPFAQLIERFESRVPGSAESAAVTVLSSGVVGTPPAQRIEVALRSPVPFVAPTLFAEPEGRFRIPSGTFQLSDGGREVVLSVPVQSRKAVDLTGNSVVLTVVDGERAFEFTMIAAAVEPTMEFGGGTPSSLIWMLGIALLGGLILNLMPCVLPVLSLKLLGAIGHGGGERGKVALSFLAAAAGIVASFLVLALAAVTAKAAGGTVGWGIQFQQPLFLVFLVLVLSLFAYNLFGLYEVGLPSWLGTAGARAGDRGGLTGHFVTGAFATLMATPCSAPFLGTAVGFALSRGPGEIFAIFAALGLGMALPYFAIAAFPGLAIRLPRPGPWMGRIRLVLGLALLGTAIWLLSVLATVTSVSIAGVIAVLLALAAAVIWLIKRRPAMQGVGIAGLLVLGTATFAAPLVGDTSPDLDAGSMTAMSDDVAWRAFDLTAIDAAIAEGNIVFVDVTADWCVTCKVNKRLVLDDEAIMRRLQAPDVVCMRADWTRPDNEIAKFLASYGRYGIPFNVVYGPGARGGLVLPELLDQESILSALDRAG